MNEEQPRREESDAPEDEATWAQDQQKRSYYYDDAHGYEIYNPDEDDEDEVNSEE